MQLGAQGHSDENLSAEFTGHRRTSNQRAANEGRLLDLDLKAAEVVVVIVEAPGGGAREANGMSFKGETA